MVSQSQDHTAAFLSPLGIHIVLIWSYSGTCDCRGYETILNLLELHTNGFMGQPNETTKQCDNPNATMTTGLWNNQAGPVTIMVVRSIYPAIAYVKSIASTYAQGPRPHPSISHKQSSSIHPSPIVIGCISLYCDHAHPSSTRYRERIQPVSGTVILSSPRNHRQALDMARRHGD